MCLRIKINTHLYIISKYLKNGALFSSPILLPPVWLQFLCYNKCIKIHNKSLFDSEYSENKNINYTKQFFNNKCTLKILSNLIEEYSLKDNQDFLYLEIMHVILKLWKFWVSATLENINILVI